MTYKVYACRCEWPIDLEDLASGFHSCGEPLIGGPFAMSEERHVICSVCKSRATMVREGVWRCPTGCTERHFPSVTTS
jgi:hypothetical protein